MAESCVDCGSPIKFLDSRAFANDKKGYVCSKCETRRIHDDQAEKKAKKEEQRKALDAVIVTSSQHIEGHYVSEYLGFESVEYVIGTGVFSEFASDLADFFGQRSKGFENKLQIAKQRTMDALKSVALRKGANAVLAVDLDYAEFSGNRVAIILNGTLVKVKPRESRRS